MSFYAVAKGHNIGIYNFWNDCKEQVVGYKGAIHKKFTNEKDAENFILNCNNTKSEFFENLYSKFDLEDVNYYIYTDGSCYNNGKENSLAAIGIYFGFNNANVSRIIESNNYKHTNNSAELTAIIECYKIIENDLKNGKKICIFSDSDYSIKCATSYGEKCAKMNWIKDIPNKELVKELYNIYSNSSNLIIKHIKAHTNSKDIHSIGNANADKLAYSAIEKYLNNLII